MAEEYEAHKTAMAAKEAAEAERKANAATISGSVATLMDDGGDDFVKKWSGPMILGSWCTCTCNICSIYMCWW